jgi:diaminopimelate epimerase
MSISFTKMHGIGNDFIIINAITQKISLKPSQIKCLANRHFGIGCDQLLLVEPALKTHNANFLMRIFNADGSEAEQCGNGIRCVAKFVYDEGLINKKEFTIATIATKSRVKLEQDGDVTVDMGKPILLPEKIPFITKVANSKTFRYNLHLLNQDIELGAVSLGNPHAIIMVDNIEEAPLLTVGKELSTHRSFPNGVNVNFMEIVTPEYIRLRVYERGCGETLGCGSGTAAAVVIGRLWKLLNETVIVELQGGKLKINYKDINSSVFMKGNAIKIFDGEFTLN